MKILLTNDDGIRAPGLAVLEEIARQFSDDIWICAPDEEQSGMGHALTLTRPVRLRRHDERRFSVTGTPTDAVTMGLRRVIDGRPTLSFRASTAGRTLLTTSPIRAPYPRRSKVPSQGSARSR